jgi:hypothetical protein
MADINERLVALGSPEKMRMELVLAKIALKKKVEEKAAAKVAETLAKEAKMLRRR